MNSGSIKKKLGYLLRRKALDRIDLHSHSILSDGELLPMELIRRAEAIGINAIAITDHVSYSNYEQVISSLTRDCQAACSEMDIVALPGVELTHVPPKLIPKLAAKCKDAGAMVILVHGETVVEPVPGGTNKSAVSCKDIDILAHPGMITALEAKRAQKNDIYLELTSRKGHNTTNGHVQKFGLKAGCKFLINTDAHSPSDMIDYEFAEKVGRGAGLDKKTLAKVMDVYTREILEKIYSRI